MNRATLLGPLLVLVLVPNTRAQGSVLVVDDDPGPGVAFSDLQSAVDAAIDGDVLLVKAGVYGGLVIDGKALVIQAEENEIVTLTDSLVVRNLAFGQGVMLRELVLRQSASVPQNTLALNDNLGPVWLEKVRVNPDDSVPVFNRFGTAVQDCLSVTMTRCELLAGVSVGVYSQNSNLTLYDSSAAGGSVGGGGAAVHVDGGTFFASGSTLNGADGFAGSPAYGNGGSGLAVHGGSPLVRYLDCSITAGLGVASTSPPGALGLNGEDIDDQSAGGVITEIVGTRRAIQKNSPVREGNVVTETHTGVAFDLIFLIFTFSQTNLAFISDFNGTFCLGSPFFVRNRGLLDANGFKAKDVTLQLFDPGVESIVFYNQVAHFDLLTSEYWLSSPTCSVHVPAAF